MESLKIIEIGKLCSHPKNPREDVGDVTELAESIKSQGLMQNLTVIRGHYMTRKEYIEAAWAEGASSKGAAGLTFDQMPWEETFCDDLDFYTVIIGHRRLAAARLAGLKELPCSVVDLTPDEQVAMMISENMQRNDLTVTEQAYGCQLMFDLGFGAPQIAEKTGLNKSTVYHRLNLAKLDRKMLKEKEADESWQFSIKDLYVLEQIEDIGKRNEILKNANSSNNLRYLAENEVQKAKENKSAEILSELLKKKGIMYSAEYDKNYWLEKFKFVQEYKLGAMYDENFDLNIDISDGATYVWRNAYHSIAVAKIVEVEEKPKEKSEWEIKNEKIKELRKIAEGIKKKMVRHIGKVIDEDMKAAHKDVENNLTKILWETLMDMGRVQNISVLYLAKFFADITDAPIEDFDSDAEEDAYVKKIFKKLQMHQQMMVALAAALDGISVVTWDGRFDSKEGEKLCFLHHLLGEYGFELSKEEKQVIHGTHELYAKE